MTAITFDTQQFVETLQKGDLREMEQRIKVDLIKWMVGLLIAQTALLVGLFNLMSGS